MNLRQAAAVSLTRVKEGVSQPQEDQVALEEPLEIQVSQLGGDEAASEWKTVAITMRTPGCDRELAAGFLFGEGLFHAARELETIYSCGARYGASGWQNRVRVALAAGTGFDLNRVQRNFYLSSSCGVCGKTSLEMLAMNHFQAVPDAGWQVDDPFVRELPDKLRHAQPVFDQTGGLHAAGLFALDGGALAVREDVGRHNAVDKVIGAQVLHGREKLGEHVLVVSGRARFELVQKAVAAQIPMLVAVGAPSSLAVQLAAEFGVTLIGFAKNSGFNIYTGPQRIRTGSATVVDSPEGVLAVH